MPRSFPEGFLWGTATSAHQVEGGNWNSDWWAWEHDPDSPCVEPSGDACDHYHRYPSDLDLLAELGFNAYRFSIEWARVEPEEGEFSQAQLEHYRRMIDACRDRGLSPVVTLHHFTSPRWVAARGGWAWSGVADAFGRFCARAADPLCDGVAVVCTINEPNVVALHGYLTGVLAPGIRRPGAREQATENFLAAHRRAVEAVRAGPGSPLVGLTLSMSDFQAVDGGEHEVARLRAEGEDPFLEAARDDDFLGVQTYSRERIGPGGHLGPEPGVETTQMGYEFWPEALAATIRRAHAVCGQVPIIVTENGIATSDDTRRIEFVRRALHGVSDCISEGIDVRGYFYWSALDNFEWMFGYRPTFGLIAVDRETLARTPKDSARWLGAIARSNALDDL